MINPYLYAKQNQGATCTLKEETDSSTCYTVEFPSSFNSQYLGNNHVIGEFHLPKNRARAPLAILIHGMGDRSVVPCRMISRTLAKKGIASFILYLVFHTIRVPESIRGRYPRLTAEEWFESYQFSVTDVRQVLDWITLRPEIDADRISVVGISFGSFIASISMSLDDRIRAGVLIESGGNSDKITRHSLLLRWQYKQNGNDFLRDQKAYSQYLAEVAEKGFEHVVPCKSSYLTDPMTFTSYQKGRPLIMLNALFDEIIPRAATLDLWKAYGKPPLHWYPATHASIWIWYPFIGSRIAGFLHSALMKY